MSTQQDQNFEDYENATEFLSVAIGGGSAGVNVRVGSDGRGFIWWTDFVANDWLEVFPSLAMALGRLALLVACSADDWSRMFAGDSAEFVATWSEFEGANLV